VTNHYLDRFIDEQRLLPPDARADGSPGGTELAAYLHRMRQIGRRTAELQNALASRPDVPDFAPELVTSDDVRRWTSDVVALAEIVYGELLRRRGDLNEPTRALVDRLLPSREDVLQRLRELLPTSVQAFKTRHHGDLHLGQVLFAKDDAFILDFEGEPERGLDERRRKTPAARDVAGLLRSVDYAATSAFERALLAWPDEHDRLLAAQEHWGRQSVATFMATYHEALTNPQLWPADTEQAERLLDFFLLEKAFYEIQYELANRPGWLRVPLMGLERLLSQRTRT